MDGRTALLVRWSALTALGTAAWVFAPGPDYAAVASFFAAGVVMAAARVLGWERVT